ncbi:hypothetical protein SEMRO_270_G104390.1 [Seminavis robusta]|uniref:Uncharacterized protein n=1 Tax=Seminavis robusta TaxID=568900 RepID=A0A9N8DQP1_9STRA|nr:hypothetical protein SEMRO_270_G104390.1 [Seminavis robusta]|eukprot:Sro270_g104390.1 n/a (328) ;mRNA; r:80914-81897
MEPKSLLPYLDAADDNGGTINKSPKTSVLVPAQAAVSTTKTNTEIPSSATEAIKETTTTPPALDVVVQTKMVPRRKTPDGWNKAILKTGHEVMGLPAFVGCRRSTCGCKELVMAPWDVKHLRHFYCQLFRSVDRNAEAEKLCNQYLGCCLDVQYPFENNPGRGKWTFQVPLFLTQHHGVAEDHCLMYQMCPQSFCELFGLHNSKLQRLKKKLQHILDSYVEGKPEGSQLWDQLTFKTRQHVNVETNEVISQEVIAYGISYCCFDPEWFNTHEQRHSCPSRNPEGHAVVLPAWVMEETSRTVQEVSTIVLAVCRDVFWAYHLLLNSKI